MNGAEVDTLTGKTFEFVIHLNNADGTYFRIDQHIYRSPSSWAQDVANTGIAVPGNFIPARSIELISWTEKGVKHERD